MIVIRIKFLVGTRSALKGEWKMRNTIMLMAAISLLELSVRRGSKTFYFLVYGNWGKVFKAFVVWMRVVYGLSGHNSFEIRPHSQAHLGTRKTSFICQLQLMRFSHKLSSLFCFLWVCVCGSSGFNKLFSNISQQILLLLFWQSGGKNWLKLILY